MAYIIHDKLWWNTASRMIRVRIRQLQLRLVSVVCNGSYVLCQDKLWQNVANHTHTYEKIQAMDTAALISNTAAEFCNGNKVFLLREVIDLKSKTINHHGVTIYKPYGQSYTY